ncbi:hypothetical protein, partial [Treponema endosymbiont of Eucomonympha sp.]|uniref:hypothetical protein n=1 Tax=Treponema endosymbiont of Eucomonympha sp. TaxID=1580831 RepID=UPI000A405F5D
EGLQFSPLPTLPIEYSHCIKYDTCMKLSEEQYKGIEALLPKQRGNVKIENLTALVYMRKHHRRKGAVGRMYRVL